MYSVVSIHNYAMTRDVKLRNLQTGTIDICFDDSELVSDENFNFMKEGREYNCKIELFGELAPNAQDDTEICKITQKAVFIGAKEMVEVVVNGDKYYVPAKKIAGLSDEEKFCFKYTRKNLIEVDNVIHADYL